MIGDGDLNLTNKKILITGGAGFVGSWTCELLLAENPAKITIIDNMIRGRRENISKIIKEDCVELIEGDICDYALLSSLVADADIVFHLAALRITHCAENPRLAFDVMAKATFDLLELCVKHNIERVIVASSASIYGHAESFPTKETESPYQNRTLYGAFKMMNEGVLRSFNDMYGLNYAATRYFNVYGPRMDIHGKYTEVLIRWMERIKEGLPPIIFGDGLQTMDFIHVKDVARFNILLAKSDISDELFNVARSEETSLLELATSLLTVMGRSDLSVTHLPERSINPVPRRLADMSKAKRILNYEAQVSLETGLEDLVTWWEAQHNLTHESLSN